MNLRVAMLCGFAAVLAVACDKVPLLAPQESTITLSSASTLVQANGTTQIHAIVIEPSGTPVHDGTTVLFTTNLGTLLPVEARTQNGVATVQFLGNGQSGTATIKALSGGSASEALELSVGAGASGRVSVTANPASVSAAGGTTTISAAVFDASGNPLSGVPVSFSTTAGTFSSVVVNSDASGTARTTLTTNQAASVTATAGSTTSAPVAITVAVRPTVTITVPGGTTPTEGAVTTLSLTVTPAASGGSPIQGVTLDYGDGSSDDLGSISGTISIQHVYGDSGSYRPTVTVVDSTGTSVTASTVIIVQPIIVSITATPSPTDPKTFTFTANVSPTGTTVASYTWTFGVGEGSPQTTSINSATHTFISTGNKTIRVIARTPTDTTVSGSTTVQVR